MGNHNTCEGEITVEAWGGSRRRDWRYKAKNGIKQITIIHGEVIDSIMFKGETEDSSPADSSTRFGGDGGVQTNKVDIDFPSEYLTGISGRYGNWTTNGLTICTLKFYTNRTQYGPFGKAPGTPFSFQAEGCVITGFHGHAGKFLDAIGVYIQPVCSLLMVVARKQHSEIEMRCLRGLLPLSPGPWPANAVNAGGRAWDDGVFAAVKEVHVHVDSDDGLISGVRFGYEKRDGAAFLSPLHGSRGKDIVKKIEVDGRSEFLIGVEGFYGPLDEVVGSNAITSLTFLTNKGRFGPMGTEIGQYFTSLTTSIASSGKVVGFHGRGGAYLDAIGVHTEYNSV